MESKHNFEQCCPWMPSILCLWQHFSSCILHFPPFSQHSFEKAFLSLETSVGINVQWTPPTVPLCGNACTTHSLKPEERDCVMRISWCWVFDDMGVLVFVCFTDQNYTCYSLKCGFFEKVVTMKMNEWYYTLWFSVTVPLYLTASDPSSNQQGFNSFCVCIVTPAVFLLCIGWLYFDVRPWGHLVTLCGRWWAPMILTTANVKWESRGLGSKRPFDRHNAVSR